jgi:hypothetical protein
MNVEAKADKAIRLAALQTIATKVADARSMAHEFVAGFEDDAWDEAEADEMQTRLDDDVVGALMDIESTIERIRNSYW